MVSTLLVQIDSLMSGLNHSRPMPKLFWPTVQMPNLLAITQKRNLFDFGQYKLFMVIYFMSYIQKCIQNPRSRKRGREVTVQLC